MVKNKFKIFCISVFFAIFVNAQAQLKPAVTAPIPIHNLQGYEDYSHTVRELIEKAQTLTQKNLTYLYGSADPKREGMDCSGTIHYLLASANLASVPRDASDMYKWVWQKGKFHAVNSTDFNSPEFAQLKPGDLLFWTGTYNVHRNPPISHVMMYLGKTREGLPLMFGASDGRTYQNKRMWGVSVFDFKLPERGSSSHFVGYSCIPNLTCG